MCVPFTFHFTLNVLHHMPWICGNSYHMAGPSGAPDILKKVICQIYGAMYKHRQYWVWLVPLF
jgi:hypothetical protein